MTRREIPLTQGKVAIVDESDYEWLTQWKWQAKRDRHTWYAARSEGPYHAQHTIRMHRQIMEAAVDVEIDHIDGDGLHNWRDNLRSATTRQNQQHRMRKMVGKTSRYKGVSRSTLVNGKPWLAQIRAGAIGPGGQAKKLHLGWFADEDEAGAAYDKAARIYFGDRAATNEAAPPEVKR